MCRSLDNDLTYSIYSMAFQIVHVSYINDHQIGTELLIIMKGSWKVNWSLKQRLNKSATVVQQSVQVFDCLDWLMHAETSGIYIIRSDSHRFTINCLCIHEPKSCRHKFIARVIDQMAFRSNICITLSLLSSVAISTSITFYVDCWVLYDNKLYEYLQWNGECIRQCLAASFKFHF